MINFYVKACPVVLSALIAVAPALAQTPRAPSDASTPPPASTPAVAPAPPSVKAKYEGGVFGYNQRMDGTLNFDDANGRLVFRDRNQKEILSLPYHSVVSAFADKAARRPAAATVAGSVPIPYGINPIGFIKKKYPYLTLEYNDPDTKVSGVTSFKLADKEILASVLSTLASKSGLSPRGPVYVRDASKTPVASQPSSPEE